MKILDCTLRDGGYINRWQFSHDFAIDCCTMIGNSGVDYIEIGLLGNHDDKSLNDCGPFRRITHEIASELKSVSSSRLSVLVDYGKYNLNNIKKDCGDNISLIRVAVHKKDLSKGIEWCNIIKQYGYQSALQIMNFPSYSKEELSSFVDSAILKLHADYVYIADSYGSMTPDDVKISINTLRELKKHFSLGFHAHNNLQMAVSNSFQAIESGCDIIDATSMGIGRGSGNLPLEILLMYVKRLGLKDVCVDNALTFAENKVLPILKEYDFGYNLKLACSGFCGVHPDYIKHIEHLPIDKAYAFLDKLSKDKISVYKPEIVQNMLNGEEII